MTAPATNTTEPDCHSRGRSRLRRIGRVIVIILIPVIIVLMIEGYLNFRGQQRLANAIADADRLDPGWRLADLLAQEPVIPDGENGALLLLDTYRNGNKN